MSKEFLTSDTSEISDTAARIAIGFSAAALTFLASLHILSPEFDPAWRMVSEYALGSYSWVLSLMFIAWAFSSWALAYSIRSQVKTRGGKIGLIFLVLAGVGEAMASVFDVKHSLHGVAALIGIPSLPIAAMLIGLSLRRNREWSGEKKGLLITANLTWISYALMTAAAIVMFTGFSQAGVDFNAEPTAERDLPPGVIALAGYANRFLIFAYCLWVMFLGWTAVRLRTRV
jgi:hypothetical protein